MLILHPRDTQAPLWSQDYDREILHRNAVLAKGEDNAMTCHRTGHEGQITYARQESGIFKERKMKGNERKRKRKKKKKEKKEKQ